MRGETSKLGWEWEGETSKFRMRMRGETSKLGWEWAEKQVNYDENEKRNK